MFVLLAYNIQPVSFTVCNTNLPQRLCHLRSTAELPLMWSTSYHPPLTSLHMSYRPLVAIKQHLNAVLISALLREGTSAWRRMCVYALELFFFSPPSCHCSRLHFHNAALQMTWVTYERWNIQSGWWIKRGALSKDRRRDPCEVCGRRVSRKTGEIRRDEEVNLERQWWNCPARSVQNFNKELSENHNCRWFSDKAPSFCSSRVWHHP